MSKIISFRVSESEHKALSNECGNSDLSSHVKSLVFDTYGDRKRAITLIREKQELDSLYRDTEQLRIDSVAQLEADVQVYKKMAETAESMADAYSEVMTMNSKDLEMLRRKNSSLESRIKELEINENKAFNEMESFRIPMVMLENKVFKYKVTTSIFATLFVFAITTIAICLKINLF